MVKRRAKAPRYLNESCEGEHGYFDFRKAKTREGWIQYYTEMYAESESREEARTVAEDRVDNDIASKELLDTRYAPRPPAGEYNRKRTGYWRQAQ